MKRFTIGTIVVSPNHALCHDLYGEVYNHDIDSNIVRIKVLFYESYVQYVGLILDFNNVFNEATEEEINKLNKLLTFQ